MKENSAEKKKKTQESERVAGSTTRIASATAA